MTVTNEQIIMAGLGALCFWFSYYVVWTSALNTMFRQKLFRVRDKLFVDAAQGHVSFNDEAYVELRAQIQRTLAAAESFNFMNMVIVQLFPGYTPPVVDPLKRMILDVERVNPSAAKIYRKCRADLFEIVKVQLAITMPFPILGTIVGCAIVYAFAKVPIKGAQYLRDWLLNSRDSSAHRLIESGLGSLC